MGFIWQSETTAKNQVKCLKNREKIAAQVGRFAKGALWLCGVRSMARSVLHEVGQWVRVLVRVLISVCIRVRCSCHRRSRCCCCCCRHCQHFYSILTLFSIPYTIQFVLHILMGCNGCCGRSKSDKQKSGNQINMRMQIMANGGGAGR